FFFLYHLLLTSFSFHASSPPTIYTLSHTTLFRSNSRSDYHINFEGVDSSFYVWVNDEFIGFSKISHSNTEFDISSFVHEGQNEIDRKSTRLNSSHVSISYAVFCLKKKITYYTSRI